jgi:hypothetical protein
LACPICPLCFLLLYSNSRVHVLPLHNCMDEHSSEMRVITNIWSKGLYKSMVSTFWVGFTDIYSFSAKEL